MKKVKNIMIEDDMKERALIRAKEMGLSFSSYVCQLIYQDTKPKEDEK